MRCQQDNRADCSPYLLSRPTSLSVLARSISEEFSSGDASRFRDDEYGSNKEITGAGGGCSGSSGSSCGAIGGPTAGGLNMPGGGGGCSGGAGGAGTCGSSGGAAAQSSGGSGSHLRSDSAHKPDKDKDKKEKEKEERDEGTREFSPLMSSSPTTHHILLSLFQNLLRCLTETYRSGDVSSAS